MNCDYVFKFIIIGDSGVGKSCLFQQFMDNIFRKSHDATLGVEFRSSIVDIMGRWIKLHIWDTAGQEQFRFIGRSFYSVVVGALLVYDITRRDSFNQLASWLEEVRQLGNHNMTIMLVGNKCELDNERGVSKEEGEQFAQQNGLLFVEASAATTLNVEEAFVRTAADILQRIQAGPIDVPHE